MPFLGGGSSGGPTPESPDAALFPIFMLSMLSLITIPATLYRLCGGFGSGVKAAAKQPVRKVADSTSEWGKQAAVQAAKLRPSFGKRVSNFLNAGNVLILVGWLLMALVVVYIQSLSNEIRPFDPYEIMGLEHGATQKEVKNAYRKLSLKYHPDKNPDPKATEYFAEYITKAYTALTDEVARENMEKYGHPDGPQAYTVGIALPAFLFENGKMAPIVLGLTVGVGILLPLGFAVCFLMNSGKYTSDNVMTTTVFHYNYLLKPMTTLHRVPETLVCAGEYISRPIPRTAAHGDAILKLATMLRKAHPEVDPKGDGAKKFFEKKHPNMVMAHLMLLAQTSREGPNVPEVLQKDFEFVVQTAPLLLEQLMQVAIRPRAPYGYGFFRPTIGVLEMCQSLTQAVPLGLRKASEKGNLGDAGMASLLQLPHVDTEVTKKLTRKKVRGLPDLLALSKPDRAAALQMAGLTEGAISDLEATLATVPVINLSATCEIEGEDMEGGIMEGDIVTAVVNIDLQRHCTKETGEQGAAPSFAPFYPFPRAENWWVVVADVAQNACMGCQKVELDELLPVPSPDDTTVTVKQVRVTFASPPAAVYNLTVMLISDFWVGCDKRVQIKVKVGKRTRADREGRAAIVRNKDDEDSDFDEMLDDGEDGGVEDYDTEEEYGTEESGSDDDDDEDSRKTK